MAFFGLFKKENTIQSTKKGFVDATVTALEKLTEDTIRITFGDDKSHGPLFQFIPGQYINVSIVLGDNEFIRSYSICSGQHEPISIAVKSVASGVISNWLNNELKVGDSILLSKPQGNFTLNNNDTNVVSIAAGSGITPIMSISKELEQRNGTMHLFYGSRNLESIVFKDALSELKRTHTTHFLSREERENFESGRITKEALIKQIKANLDLLKADVFFICGHEELIMETRDALKFFGVADSKIKFELFTTPVLMKQETAIPTSDFSGIAHVKAILDSEVVDFDLNTAGKTLLEAVEDAGLDAPYSCKGGVCCSCKAKILKGSASMSMNFSLTDEEIRNGYILTCQAHPTSEELTITYDV